MVVGFALHPKLLSLSQPECFLRGKFFWVELLLSSFEFPMCFVHVLNFLLILLLFVLEFATEIFVSIQTSFFFGKDSFNLLKVDFLH